MARGLLKRPGSATVKAMTVGSPAAPKMGAAPGTVKLGTQAVDPLHEEMSSLGLAEENRAERKTPTLPTKDGGTQGADGKEAMDAAGIGPDQGSLAANVGKSLGMALDFGLTATNPPALFGRALEIGWNMTQGKKDILEESLSPRAFFNELFGIEESVDKEKELTNTTPDAPTNQGLGTPPGTAAIGSATSTDTGEDEGDADAGPGDTGGVGGGVGGPGAGASGGVGGGDGGMGTGPGDSDSDDGDGF